MQAVIKYFHLKGMIMQEIVCDMETSGQPDPAYNTVIKWHAELKHGRLSCRELHHCGPLATSVNEETIEMVNKLVMNDRR